MAVPTGNKARCSVQTPLPADGKHLCHAHIRSATASLIEPDIFETPAIVDAIDHDRQTLDIGASAGPSAVVEKGRLSAILCQSFLYFPHQSLAPFLMASRDCCSISSSTSGLQYPI